MKKSRIPFLPAWTPRIIVNLLKRTPCPEDDWEITRERIVRGVDGFGLTAPESAALHTLSNTEAMKALMEKLVTPLPGERTNLEKILAFQETIVKLLLKLQENQKEVLERLAALEAQIFVLNAASPNLDSANKSTD
jgi:hypothetical protein